MTKSRKAPIEELKKLVDKYQLSPESFRYIVRKVARTKQLTLSKHPKKSVKFLLPEKMYHFCKTALELSPKHRLFADLLFTTGLRISELHNLDIRDIDLHTNSLLVRQGKGGKDRTVLIPDSVIHKIRLFLGDRKTGNIFLKKNGRPVAIRTMQRWFQQISEKAGFGVMNPHIARHTFATFLAYKNTPLQDIQYLLGHSSIKTTEIYAKLLPSEDRKNAYLRIMEGK